MATVTLTIPDAQLTRVVAAVCAANNLPPTNANAQLALRNWLTSTVVDYERRLATAQAVNAVVIPVDPGIT